MDRPKVSIFKYQRHTGSVRKAVAAANALAHLPKHAKVVIKPNIVVWLDGPYPKWGVVTTSAVVEESVILLKEQGINDITIVEGSLQMTPGSTGMGQRAFNGLGYQKLKDRYGVKLVDVWESGFEKVDIGDGLHLKVNSDLLASDFLLNLPVLKTHAQVKVSLGIKNLKGFLNVSSRKKCHSADHEQDLEFMISRLPALLPPSATIIDGIYTIERGPSFDGKPRKTDLVIASADPLAADMVGGALLGHNPAEIPYLVRTAADRDMAADLSQCDIVGESLEDHASFHHFTFPYNEDNTLPLTMEKMGIKGLKFHKYDSTLCTYCSPLIGMLLTLIGMSYKGDPYDNVEFLTGKRLVPSPDIKTSILVGQCMCARNKHHSGPQKIVEIPGCPPDSKAAARALKELGIDIDPAFLTNFEMAGAFFMERFKNKPEFDESFYTIE